MILSRHSDIAAKTSQSLSHLTLRDSLMNCCRVVLHKRQKMPTYSDLPSRWPSDKKTKDGSHGNNISPSFPIPSDETSCSPTSRGSDLAYTALDLANTEYPPAYNDALHKPLSPGLERTEMREQYPKSQNDRLEYIHPTGLFAHG